MRSRPNAQSGFTLIELAIAIAIIGVLAVIAGSAMSRSKPRANLANAALELQVLIHQARQTALADGKPVSVLVYPNYAPPSGADRNSTGYFIMYEDACFDFYTGGATGGVAYGTYNPAVPTYGACAAGTSVVIDTMPLPSGVLVGPATGMGAAPLKAPLNNINVQVACSFCGTTGGAIQFDTRGQAWFYALNGTTVAGPLSTSTTPAVNGGASISLGYDPNVTDAVGQRTLVILSGSGAVAVMNNG